MAPKTDKRLGIGYHQVDGGLKGERSAGYLPAQLDCPARMHVLLGHDKATCRERDATESLDQRSTIQDVLITRTHAEATVSNLFRSDLMERYGVALDLVGRRWDEFIPIARAFGMRFGTTWTFAGDEVIRLEAI